jgi:hypothetical protein
MKTILILMAIIIAVMIIAVLALGLLCISLKARIAHTHESSLQENCHISLELLNIDGYDQ